MMRSHRQKSWKSNSSQEVVTKETSCHGAVSGTWERAGSAQSGLLCVFSAETLLVQKQCASWFLNTQQDSGPASLSPGCP